LKTERNPTTRVLNIGVTWRALLRFKIGLCVIQLKKVDQKWI
jgi:hypothetical protein